MHGTVVATPGYKPDADAEGLRKAMKGIGTDEAAIIQIVGARTSQELKQVEVAFKTFYGKDLKEDIHSEISGHFRETVLDRFLTADEFDAQCIRNAVKGAGTDELALIEILCTRNNAQIHAAKDAYKRMYNHDMEKDIADDTSGYFKRILVALLQGARDESGQVNQQTAHEDAEKLYKAGEGKWGTDEVAFIQVLASRSHHQLNMIFAEYHKVSGHEFEKAVEREFSGNIKDALLALVKATRNVHEFFADRLYHSMKGLGTDDRTLVRVVVSRCEVDMVEIKQAFEHKYKKSLAKFIEEDTSGDYKRMLVKLVGN